MSRWANFKIKSQKWHWTKNCQGQPTSWMHHHPRFLIKLFFKLAHNLAILPFLVRIPQNKGDVEICTIFRGNYFFFYFLILNLNLRIIVKMFVDWTSLTSGLSFNHSKYFLAISGNLLKKDKVWAELRKHFKWGNVFSFFQ